MKKSETAELNFQQQGRTELERNYKDTVFVTVFHEKAKLIELYNAIFDTDYDKDTAIDIVTIKDVLFRTLKNDVSFVLDKRFVVLVEHQSTINGNLPLRDLLYMSTVLKRMIDTKQLYREKTLRIPRPAFIVLDNGPDDIPEHQELRFLAKAKNPVNARRRWILRKACRRNTSTRTSFQKSQGLRLLRLRNCKAEKTESQRKT